MNFMKVKKIKFEYNRQRSWEEEDLNIDQVVKL